MVGIGVCDIAYAHLLMIATRHCRRLASMSGTERRADPPPPNWSDVGTRELLPTGTVTLLLADVEGSTRLWQVQPDEMTAAVARLDVSLARIVRAHHGVRPVEQGEGDSFVIAFTRASDAVACALELQRAPLAPIKLRIGLHTGEIQMRDEANYVGPTINRAARVRDLAHGSQTVLTAATEELVIDHLPPGTWLTDLGSHKLRDIPRPERVVQLCHPDLRVDFPAPRSSGTVATPSLPVQLNSFVGRTAEIAELRDILGESRLVTLTGAGGVGKTRLAVELTAQLAAQAGSTIHYVDLAPITDPDLVGDAVARAIGLPDHAGRSTVESLTRRIGDRHVLIVLDNCEHLLEETAALIDPLLAGCPAVRLLATSREPLHVAAEMTWQVPSLSLADEAIELFTDRARSVRRDFTVTDDNATTVTEICRRLDGMPLAIELAAARVRALSPAEILDGLHDRFRLLSGGARTAVRRQQTLRASVDWSHSLLTQAESVLFRRLSVFVAGFDLDAAMAVCGSGDVPRYQVLDQLALLVEKSLVQAESTGDRTRYRMLETVRQFAREKLDESGEADVIHTAHRDHYSSLADQLNLPGRTDFRRRVERAEVDIDNLRAAFSWSRDREEIARAMELASSLQPLWQARGRLREGRAWFDAVLDDDSTDVETVAPAAYARALADKAMLDSFVGASDGMALANRAVTIARGLDDPALLARALTASGCIAGNDLEAAAPFFAEAMGIARAIGDDWLLSQVLAREAYAAAMTGDPAAANAFGVEGSDVAGAIGDWFGAHVSRWSMGMARMMWADLPGALCLYRAVFVEARADNDIFGTLVSLISEGAALVMQGRIAEARTVAHAAIEAGAELDVAAEGAAVTILALVAAVTGDGAVAAQTTEAAWRLPGVQRGTVAASTVALAALVNGDFAAAEQYADEAVATLAGWHRMWALTVRSYVALARANHEQAQKDVYEALSIGADNGGRLGLPHMLDCLARLSAIAGRHADGARLFGAADAVRHRTGEQRFPVFEEGYVASVESCRVQLGDNDFETAWVEGAALSTGEAMAHALRGRSVRSRPASGWASLTPAELDVVRLVSEGLANKDIAERLRVSPRTVQAHLTHVYTKLDFTSRVQLAQEATRQGRASSEGSTGEC